MEMMDSIPSAYQSHTATSTLGDEKLECNSWERAPKNEWFGVSDFDYGGASDGRNIESGRPTVSIRKVSLPPLFSLFCVLIVILEKTTMLLSTGTATRHRDGG